MRRGTAFLGTAGLLLLAACTTRTIVVRQPAPERDRPGSRPPPRDYPPPPEPERPRPNTAVTLGIPPGHLPNPGECRVWIPGTPPGQQPRPQSRPCAGIADVAPAGSWIVYRPTDDRRVVHVRLVDERRAGQVVLIRIFDIATEQLLREEDPPPEQRADRPPPRDQPRDRGTVTLDVPPGHLPDPGECRVWVPGTPPGRQSGPRSRSCDGIAATAPAGSWIVYRPPDDRKLVHVRVVDARRAGVVIHIWIFDIATERLVREEEPREDVGQNRPFERRPDIQPPAERPQEQRPPEQRPPEQRPPEQLPPPQIQPPAENKPPEQRPPEQRPPADKPPEEPPPPAGTVTLDVPPGHLPDVGACRVWIPGTPPGRQPRPKSRTCAGINAFAPAGSWILFRPANDTKVVHVRIVDPSRSGVVIRVRIFDVDTKRLVREESP